MERKTFNAWLRSFNCVVRNQSNSSPGVISTISKLFEIKPNAKLTEVEMIRIYSGKALFTPRTVS